MSDCVYARLQGGLGNQMFQYAAGKSLAYKKNCEFKLDIRGFKKTHIRAFELDNFNIDCEIAQPEELSKLLRGGKLTAFATRKSGRIKPMTYKQGRLFREPHYHFSPQLFSQTPPVLIQGYWQSHKYFDEIKSELQQNFTPKKPLSGNSNDMLKRINDCEMSISVHVRRGDYAVTEDLRSTEVHETLGYYRRAIALMKDIYPNATFFAFSDDMEFTLDNLGNVTEFVPIEGNQRAGFEDMMLMRACNHNIIANSSFSWWGAWLNNYVNKKVIAPRKWFSDKALHDYHTYDIYPDEWITLG